MTEALQSYDVTIDADVDACIEVLLDFERYPEWSSPILDAAVLRRDEAGRAEHVEFSLDMRIRTIRYALAYTFELPNRISWTLVGGDLAGVNGSYDLEPTSAGVRATCHQEIDIGFWVPGPIRRMAERQALRDSVLEFKAEVERRKSA